MSSRTEDEQIAHEMHGIWQANDRVLGAGYVHFFQQAAGALADRTRSEPMLVHSLGPPMLFLVRHAVETMLKELLLLANRVDALRSRHDYNGKVNREHDLRELLADLKDKLRALKLDGPGNALEDLVREICDLECGNVFAAR